MQVNRDILENNGFPRNKIAIIKSTQKNLYKYLKEQGDCIATNYIKYINECCNLNIKLSDMYYVLEPKGISNFYDWMRDRSPYPNLQLLRNAINRSFCNAPQQIQSFQKKKKLVELYKEYAE